VGHGSRWTFCSVFVVQCVKLMLRIFEFGVLLFDCFVYCRNVTCLKRFTRYRHYTGEVEYIIIGRLTVKLPKIRPFSCGLTIVEFYLYLTVGTVLIHSVKPELTE